MTSLDAAPATVSRLMVPLVGVVTAAHLALGVAATLERGAFFVTYPLTGCVLAGAGAIAWGSRPHSRTGPLLVLVSALWLWVEAFQFVDNAIVFSLSLMFVNSAIPVLAHIVIAFPTGRLAALEDRLAVAAIYVYGFVFIPVQSVLTEPAESDCPGCPENVFSVADVDALDVAYVALTIPLALWGLSIFVRRWRRASRPARRVLAPVVLGGIVAAAGLAIANGIFAAKGGAAASRLLYDDALYQVAAITYNLGICAAALGFLAGLLRTRVTRSTIGQLIVALGGLPETGPLRDLLARALGDDTLEVGYRVGDGYVDDEGRPLAVPGAEERTRAATHVEQDGRPVAVLVHDPALHDDEGLVDAVVAAARLALENERLKAEVKAQLAAIRDSRARIVEAADQERKRIERDLHDGAQQRLVSLAVALRLAQTRLAKVGESAPGELLERAAGEAKLALEELRELAQGLHPQVLSQEGLAAALESLAERSPVPVVIKEVARERLPEPVEACAYFVCSEALQNVAKYAQASRAEVAASRRNGQLELSIADDGIGGAHVGKGSGLRGLVDRVEAAGGRLTVDSPAGRGTRLHATIPLYGDSGSAPMTTLDAPGTL